MDGGSQPVVRAGPSKPTTVGFAGTSTISPRSHGSVLPTCAAEPGVPGYSFAAALTGGSSGLAESGGSVAPGGRSSGTVGEAGRGDSITGLTGGSETGCASSSTAGDVWAAPAATASATADVTRRSISSWKIALCACTL